MKVSVFKSYENYFGILNFSIPTDIYAVLKQQKITMPGTGLFKLKK